MAKRKKTIIAGSIVKTIIYTAPEPLDGKRTRAEKSRMTTAAQKAMNDKAARGRLEMLMAANFTGRDLFITTTYRDDDLPPNRAEAVVEGLSGEIIRDICRKTENETGIHFTVEPVLPDVSANQGERWFIRATGTSTHASTPWEGNNAVTGLIKAAASLPLSDSAGFRTLNGLAEIFPHNDYYGVAAGVAQKDEISGVLTLGTNMVDYQVTGLMGKIDSRAPLCASKENMLDVLRARLDAEGIQMDPESRMTPPHHVPEDKPFVQTLLSCYEQVMGEKGYCMAIGGGTYAHRLENGVAFGCMKLGTDYHMHGADEYLIIDEMVRSAELFALAIAEICQ